MKCVDILRALNNDEGDLKSVRSHLESCAECSRKFARDLEIEEALRNLGIEVSSVDIAAEIRNSISLLNQRQSTYNLIRRGIWITVSVATMALLIISMPILAGWLSKAYSLANSCDICRSIDSMISSTQCIYLFYLMAAVLAWVASYLWQETKKSVQ